MRKVILIIIALGLLITLALALTACPRTTELKPGQGDVVTEPAMPAIQESETEIPPEGIATTPEEMEALEPVDEGAEAGDEEAVEPEDGGEATSSDEEDNNGEEGEEAGDEEATE